LNDNLQHQETFQLSFTIILSKKRKKISLLFIECNLYQASKSACYGALRKIKEGKWRQSETKRQSKREKCQVSGIEWAF